MARKPKRRRVTQRAYSSPSEGFAGFLVLQPKDEANPHQSTTSATPLRLKLLQPFWGGLMERSTQRPTLKNASALRVGIALLLVAIVYASAAHPVASAARSYFSVQIHGVATHPNPAVIHRSSISGHCCVLYVAVTHTLTFPTPSWPVPSPGIWSSETAIAAPVGYVSQLFRPPKTLPKQARLGRSGALRRHSTPS